MADKMNKVEKLINELCPDGVEYKELGEVSKNENLRNKDQKINEVRSVTNTKGLIDTEVFFENSRTSKNTSNYKVVRKGMIVYNPSRINVGSIGIHQENFPVIVSPMYTVISIDTNKLNLQYLKYFLSSKSFKYQMMNKVEVGARFRFTYDSFSKLKIPIPPLPIQEEIVRILDKFTELEAELEAELKARKKQYEYYRDELLTFKDGEVEWKKLEEVCEIEDNKRKPIKSSLRIKGEIPYYGANNIQDYVDGFTHNGEYILLAEDGSASLDNYSVQYVNGKFWANNHVHVIKGKGFVLNRFLFHWFKNMSFIPYLTGGTRAKLTRSKLITIKIPIPYKNGKPDLEKQKQIVAILDKFDALVNDISQGLPAEIEARRKQYEYYREKLLTFKEKDKNE